MDSSCANQFHMPEGNEVPGPAAPSQNMLMRNDDHGDDRHGSDGCGASMMVTMVVVVGIVDNGGVKKS